MSNQYVISVIEEVSRLLTPIGMELKKDASRNIMGASASWCRECAWKIDSVELFHDRARPNRFFVSYVLYLKGTDIPRRVFDGMALEGFRRGTTVFLLPKGVGKLLMTPARFAADVAKKAAAQLCWFDELDTPEKCLRRLRTGETNGAGTGGKAFDIIETTLKALAARQPNA